MKQVKEQFSYFLKNKIYCAMLTLTAVMGYGFMITHQTIGIDDTPYAYYFEEGLSAIVGRWVFFLLNRIFHVSDFTPFVTDLAGVLILMTVVTVWAALFRSVLKDRVPAWSYCFFACIFLSCPLISEVYTYYLHNGVSLGYLCTGISLFFYRDMAEAEKDRRKMAVAGLGAVVMLWIALGCYESFMIVWLLGVFLVLLTRRYAGAGQKVIPALVKGAAAAVAAILLRSLMISAVTAVFGLDSLSGEAVRRSVGEMAAWMFLPGAAAEFAMALKRIFVMYGVFAYAYYPIRVFVLASAVTGIFGLYWTIWHRDIRCLLLTGGSYVVSFLLVIVEGSATLYRSAQFLPVICGYAVLIFSLAAEGLLTWIRKRINRRGKGSAWEKAGAGAVIFILCAVLWNQCFDLNRWFYVDYMKYENARELAGEIQAELERHFDTSKPVVFTGTYQAPQGIIGDAYVPYGSETFYKMNRLTCLVDEHLLEKYYRPYGVWVAQTPALSMIDWGINAFENDEELVRFFAMHGYEIQGNRDQQRYQEAQEYSVSLPHFPAEGSVVDMGEYLIVHF